MLLRQHRTIASASLRRLFAPLLQFEKPEIQRVKKASQSLPPAGGKGILIIFCRGAPQGGLSCPFGAIHLLYLTENTYQAASVRFVRQGVQIVRAADCNPFVKKAKPFFDSLKYIQDSFVFQTLNWGKNPV